MKKILIVDDEPAVLATLDCVLTAAGHTTRTAANGFEALRIAETEGFDFALIDLVLPGLDGFAVCQRLAAAAAAKGWTVPVIWMITGAHTVEAAQKARLVGARDLLRKPFDLLALLHALEGAPGVFPGEPGGGGAGAPHALGSAA